MTTTHDDDERRKVNRLIDFYEAKRPDSGQRIDLSYTPKQLCKLFGVRPQEDGRRQVWPCDIPYRGRTLHASKGA